MFGLVNNCLNMYVCMHAAISCRCLHGNCIYDVAIGNWIKEAPPYLM